MPINRNVEALKKNPLIISFSKLLGLGVPIASGLMFASLIFGWHQVNADGDCFAVEYPEKRMFPTSNEADMIKYKGLNIVNVSSRLNTLAYVGFIVEIIVLLISLSGIMNKRRHDDCADCCGFIQVIIFVILMFYRYDWYGSVCNGS